ncbi:MAG: accessory factor UbiK family protein [Gammaproteobacteria bacterium]|nr:accessory factor UbiK family protein [Gammaproteobacteria bacterium]
MIETKLLDDLARKLAGTMPRGVSAFQREIEKNLRAGLEAVFQRLDLVTREEYEVQVALLARSRDKLAAMEARIAELEGKGEAKTPPAQDHRAPFDTI